jgi:hypothetical protein
VDSAIRAHEMALPSARERSGNRSPGAWACQTSHRQARWRTGPGVRPAARGRGGRGRQRRTRRVTRCDP